jgi:hypothetical protein
VENIIAIENAASLRTEASSAKEIEQKSKSVLPENNAVVNIFFHFGEVGGGG